MKKIILTLLILFFVFPIFAEDGEYKPWAFNFGGPELYRGYIPVGASFSLHFTPPPFLANLETSLAMHMRVAIFEEKEAYHNTTTGQAILPADNLDLSENADYSVRNSAGHVNIGVAQELIENLPLYYYLYYRLDVNIPTLDPAKTPDDMLATVLVNNNFSDSTLFYESSAVTGFHYVSVSRDSHNAMSGLDTEVYLQYVPGFLNLVDTNSALNYYKTGIQSTLYVPLFDINPDEFLNTFNMYIANRFLFDFVNVAGAYGSVLPLWSTQDFGVTRPVTGLGGAIRGVESASYDSVLKVANNLELRIVGPAFVLPSLNIIGFVFLDTGYYQGFYQGSLDAIQPDSGILASTGGGLGLNVLGIVQIGYQVSYLLEGAALSSTATELSHGLMVNLHF